MKRAFLLLFAIAFAYPMFSQHRSDVITIATQPNNYPYYFINNNGNSEGYIADFIKVLMDSIDTEYKFVAETLNTFHFNDSVKSLLNEYDLLSTTIAPRRRRLGGYHSTPYLKIEFLVVAHEEASDGSPRDYNQKKLVTVRNSPAHMRILTLTYKEFKGKLIVAQSINEALDMVINGKADYFMHPANFTKEYQADLKKLNLIGIHSNFPALEISLVSKNQQLIERIDKVIDDLYANGAIDNLSNKWLDYYPKAFNSELLFIILILVIVILFLLIVVRIHRRMVSKAVEKNRMALERNNELIASINLLLHDDKSDIFMFDIIDRKFHQLINGRFEETKFPSVFSIEKLHPEDMVKYEEISTNIKNREVRRKSFELRVKQSDEKYTHYEHFVIPIREEGVVVKYIFSRRDISDHREELQSRTDSIIGLQMAMQLTSTARWDYDRENQFVKLIDKDGKSKEILVESLTERLSKEEQQKLNDYLDQVQETQVSQITTIKVLNADDPERSRLFQLNASVKYDSESKKEILTGVINDISDQYRSKKQIEDLQRNITLALEAGGLSTWTYNRSKDIYTILHGDSTEAQVLSGEEYTAITHPHDRRILSDAMEKIISGEERRLEVKLRINTNGYNYIWLSCYLMPVFEEDGSINIITGTRQDITKEIYREIELKQEQSILQSIIDNLPVPVYIKDPVTQEIAYKNESAMRLYLIDDETQYLSGALSPESYEKCLAIDRKVLLLREEYKAHENITLINGDPRNTFVQKNIINYNHKDQILVVRYDYTEQQKLEAAQKILSVSLPAINAYTWRIEGNTKAISYQSSSEIEQEKLSAMYTVDKRAEFVHKDDRDYFLNTVDEYIKKGEGTFYMSYRSKINADDDYNWWDVRGVAEVIDSDDEQYTVLNGISINVHQQKMNELKLRKANNQNEIILNNSSSGIIYIDKKFNIQWSNMEHELQDKIIAFLKEKYVNFANLNAIHQTDVGAKNSLFNKFVDNDSQIYDTWTIPTVRENIYDGAVIRVDNVTKREIMINDLAQAKEKAEESERLKMAFLANMSHEIRTPLNAIVGFSELLFDTDEEEERGEYIDLIKRNNEILLRLIGDILDLSKIESGSMEMNPVEIDFAQFFESIYATWIQKSSETGVELIKEDPYDYCLVRLDNKFISQIATNFMSNAFKYCPTGTITMGYEYQNEGIKFYVKDTGIGIEPDKLALTFGRFAKLDDFAQGTGLGLSICKALAETAGGKVGVESEFGKGSTFWAWIPTQVDIKLKEESTPNADNRIEIQDTSNDEVEDGIKRVLVAEDNDSNYTLIQALLKKEFELTHALNGQEALELAKNNKYDAILMDMRMPIMDGLEATRKIREFDKDILIISLTGNAFDFDRKAALDAGSDIFMTKPIKRQELIDNLKHKK